MPCAPARRTRTYVPAPACHHCRLYCCSPVPCLCHHHHLHLGACLHWHTTHLPQLPHVLSGPVTAATCTLYNTAARIPATPSFPTTRATFCTFFITPVFRAARYRTLPTASPSPIAAYLPRTRLTRVWPGLPVRCRSAARCLPHLFLPSHPAAPPTRFSGGHCVTGLCCLQWAMRLLGM